MLYVNNGSSYLSNYASSLVTSYTMDGPKYVDVYPIGTSDSAGNNYAAWSNIEGDAVYETSNNSAIMTTGSWDGGCSYAPFSDSPIFRRGGRYNNDPSSSVFCFSNDTGNGADSGFRVVLGIQ